MAGERVLLLCLALSGAGLGCRPKRVPQEPPREALLGRDVTLYVAVSDAVAKTDTGNVAAMVEAIEADLREEGHTVTTVVARSDERPPKARLEVQVLNSDSGDAAVRGAGHLVELGTAGGVLGPVGSVVAYAERGKIVLDAYVVRSGSQPAVYLGRVEASSFGAVSDEAIAAGERSGHFIAWRALHGSWPAPGPSRAPQ
jgi:hypothetical protein